VNYLPQLNDLIKDEINKVIQTQTSGIRLSTYWKPMSSYASVKEKIGSPSANWMSQSDIQKKFIRELHLPGTHDSGAIQLTKGLAQTKDAVGQGIKYKEIGFLWRLRPDMAPSNGEWPFPNNSDDNGSIFVGKEFYSEITQRVVKGIAEAGDQDFARQLELGIRWFDVRIYLDLDDNFYLQLALRGPLFSDVLKQVKAFIDAHPEGQELVFLDLSHANFDETAAAKVSDLIKEILPPQNLPHFVNDQGSTKFDFQSLNRTVGSLVGEQTKVMILNSDCWGRQYPAPITNTPGFNESGPDLQFFRWYKEPAVSDIVPWIAQHLKSGGETDGLLKLLATHHNGLLEDELKKNLKANVVSVDWPQCSSGKLPVEQILALNSAS
jgi:hypothetical protein